MSQMGLTFTVSPSNVDEIMDQNMESHEVAVSLARQKCTDIATQTKHDCFVIGADTIVVKDKKLLGKPASEQDALEMLKNLNGQWHEVVTGVCICRTRDMKILSCFETTKVKIAEKSEEFLKAYIATKEPFDKAGAYGIQGYGSLLVERIDGDYFNVMGLPIYRLSCMLEELGYSINLRNITRR